MDVTTLFIVLLCLILAIAFIIQRRCRRQNLPPGPMGWPGIGIIPILSRAEHHGKHPHTVMSELCHRYGTVFSFRLGTRLVVCLNTLESIKEAFNNNDICAREATLLHSIPGCPGEGVVSSSGRVWSDHRRFMSTIFRKFDVSKTVFQDKIIDEAEYLADVIGEFSGQPIHLHRYLANASANAVSAVLFGKHYDYKNDEFCELLQHIRSVLKFIGAGGKVFFLPPVLVKNVVYRKQYQEYVQHVNYFRHLFRNLIEEHKEHGQVGEDVQDLIDAYFVEMAKSPHGKSSFNAQNLEANMGDLICAAFDTTSHTLLWLFLYMIHYPEVQIRIQSELDSAIGPTGLPRLSDSANIPYTEAVILEVQRMQTTLPLGGQHSTTKDTTIQGFDVPKGSIVLSNLWHVHHDPNAWEDPDVFRPERFLDESGRVVVPPHFIPFSIGKRSCIGEKMARAELFYFVTHLLHKFTFTKPNGAPETPFIGSMGLSYGPPHFEVCAAPRI
ncbi:cytochrome P450 2J6-like [Amphiura filiformis]|uniref:cytochrome P450 2J6-like n=1 Tax=Amphiura filiformis TaxID=82378 RepID=UPI003B210DD3